MVDERVKFQVDLETSAAVQAAAAFRRSLDQLSGGFSSAQGGAFGLVRSLAGMAASFAPMAAATAIIGGLGFALHKSVEAAAESADTMHQLETAVLRTAAGSKRATEQIEAAVQALFKTSAFDDEPLRRAATLFVTITGNAQGAAEALKPIADLSAALGVDLETAARQVAKAEEGMVVSLQRAGIMFTASEQKMLKAATAGDRLALILDKIESKVGGAAAAQLGTYAGQVANFKKEWDELAEAIGSRLLPVLTQTFELLGLLPALLAKLPDIASKIPGVNKLGLGEQASVFKQLFSNEALAKAGVPSLNEVLFAAAGKQTAKDVIGDEETYSEFGKGAGEKFIKGFHEGTTSGGVFGNLYAEVLDEITAKTNALAQSNAFAKMAPEMERARQALAAMSRDLKEFKADAELKLRPPDLGPVETAVRTVTDRVDAIIKGASDKAQALADDAKQQAADIVSLNVQLAEQSAKQVVNLDAVIGLQERIANARKQQAQDIATAQGYREYAVEVQRIKVSLEEIARSNELAKMADKAIEKITALREEIAKIAADARAQVLPEFLSQVNAAERSALEASSVEAANAAVKPLIEASKVVRAAIKDSMDELQAGFERLADTLSSVFESIALGGADGFASAMKKAMSGLVNDFGKTLAEKVLTAFGAKPTKTQAQIDALAPEDRKAYFESTQQKQNIIGAVVGVAAGITQTIDILNAAKKGQETSILSTALAFASVGAAIGSAVIGLGTIIGAAIGAVVGIVIAVVANAKAKASRPYAYFGINDQGQAFVEPFEGREQAFKNLTEVRKNEMLAQIQSTYDEFTSAYVKILLKLPLRVLASLGDISATAAGAIAPTVRAPSKSNLSFWDTIFLMHTGFLYGPGGTGGAFGSGTTKDTFGPGVLNPGGSLKNFDQIFADWVKDTLPREVAQRFQDTLATGFIQLGLTVEKWDEISKQLKGMDPKAAVAVLGDITDALVSFDRVSQLLANLKPGGGFEQAFGIGGKLTATGAAQGKEISDYTQSLIDASEKLTKQGLAIYDLPFADQAAAAKELGASLEQLGTSLVTFLGTVLEASKSINQSVTDAKFALALGQVGTPGAKEALLTQRLKSDEARIAHAAALGLSVQEVQALTQDAISVVNQLVALDPKKFAKWANDQFDYLNKIAQRSLGAIGEQAKKQFIAIVEAMQPVLDYFEGKIPTAAEAVVVAFDNLAGALGGGVAGGGAGGGGGRLQKNRATAPGQQGDLPQGELFTRASRTASASSDSAAVLVELKLLNVQLREGRDIRVTNRLEVVSGDNETVFDDGFADRTIRGRRAS